MGLAAADPWYAPAALKPYPSWPGVVGPGFESTCYGCGLGKRSADAEPEAWAPYGYGLGWGVAGHPGAAVSYTQRSPQGIGKRSAEPWGYYGLGYGLGVAGHPTGVSYTQRSPQGLGKRSAEPWGYYGLGYGVAGHYGGGVSYSNRSPQGLGKREAEEEDPKALATHPSGGTSYVGRTVFGYPVKRSAEGEEEVAEAEPEAPKRGYVFIGPTTWGFPAAAKEVEKRDADPAVSYSNRSPQGAYGFGYGYGPAPYYWG